eukprot:179737-Prymnesium_polylepis.1
MGRSAIRYTARSVPSALHAHARAGPPLARIAASPPGSPRAAAHRFTLPCRVPLLLVRRRPVEQALRVAPAKVAAVVAVLLVRLRPQLGPPARDE